jgi:hypothetical protein
MAAQPGAVPGEQGVLVPAITGQHIENAVARVNTTGALTGTAPQAGTPPFALGLRAWGLATSSACVPATSTCHVRFFHLSSRPGSFVPPSLRSLLAAFALFIFACQPEIGDSCSNASDCSVQDQRTCDTTFPGGYCTVFGCGADTCPEESTCVGFQSVLSIAPECSDIAVRPRLQRTACMRSCSRNSDCRGGYACVDVSLANPWGALVIDSSARGRVCALLPPESPVGETGVCEHGTPVDVPPLDVPPLDAGSDADADAALL